MNRIPNPPHPPNSDHQDLYWHPPVEVRPQPAKPVVASWGPQVAPQPQAPAPVQGYGGVPGPSRSQFSANFPENRPSTNFFADHSSGAQPPWRVQAASVGPEVYDTGVALQQIWPQAVCPSHVLPPRAPPPPRREGNFSVFSGSGPFGQESPFRPPESHPDPQERSQTLRGIWGQDKGELEALDPDLKRSILRHLKLPKWDGEPKSFDLFRKMFLVWYEHFAPKVDDNTLARSICAALPPKMQAFYEGCHFHHKWGYAQIWDHLCTHVAQLQPEFFHVNTWESLRLPSEKGWLEYSTWYCEWLLLLGQAGPQLASTVKQRYMQALETHGGYESEVKKVYKREVTRSVKLSQPECHKIVADHLLSEHMTSSLKGQTSAGITVSAAFARGPHNPRQRSQSRTPPRSTSGSECLGCGKSGHGVSDCPNKADWRCNACKGRGHWSAECPNKGCRNCGSLGHWRRDCPKPKQVRSRTPERGSGDRKKWDRPRSRSGSRESTRSGAGSDRPPRSPGRESRPPQRSASEKSPRKNSGDRTRNRPRSSSPYPRRVSQVQDSAESGSSPVVPSDLY